MTTSKHTAGTMTTFSVRCWSGQLDRIKAAALVQGKNPPEWILDRLMPATEDVLGDIAPLYPEIKRRPSTAPTADVSPAVARAASKLGVDPQDLRLIVREILAETARPDRSVSGTRTAVGTPHR